MTTLQDHEQQKKKKQKLYQQNSLNVINRPFSLQQWELQVITMDLTGWQIIFNLSFYFIVLEQQFSNGMNWIKKDIEWIALGCYAKRGDRSSFCFDSFQFSFFFLISANKSNQFWVFFFYFICFGGGSAIKMKSTLFKQANGPNRGNISSAWYYQPNYINWLTLPLPFARQQKWSNVMHFLLTSVGITIIHPAPVSFIPLGINECWMLKRSFWMWFPCIHTFISLYFFSPLNT